MNKNEHNKGGEIVRAGDMSERGNVLHSGQWSGVPARALLCRFSYYVSTDARQTLRTDVANYRHVMLPSRRKQPSNSELLCYSTRQEAQLSQRGTEYFSKSLNVIRSDTH